jgi:hypothetical protein
MVSSGGLALGTIDAVDYLLGATLYQASIKPPLGTIDVVDYLLGTTLYQASININGS